jgi:hypothetical protein
MELHSGLYEHAEPHGKKASMAEKNAAAVSLGSKGGKATARNRTPEERADAARKAVQARWAKTKKLVAEIKEGTKELLKTAKANARKADARRAKLPKEKAAK